MSLISHSAYAQSWKQRWSRDGQKRWSPLRGVFFFVALVAALLVGPGKSMAAPPELVAGTGTIGMFGNPTLHVNAVNTPAGVRGGFMIMYPDGTFVRGVVTCLFVSGNTAYVTARIVQSTGPRQATFPVGDFIAIGVQDNGSPGTGPTPDLVNFSPGFPAPPDPTVCGPNPAAFPNIPIVQGNFQVFDA